MYEDGAAARVNAERIPMRIVKMEMFDVPPRWLFLRLETDSGIVGWGEPIVEGKADVVRSAVESLRELIIGADARRIEDFWQLATKGGFYRGGPVLSSAVAGIDQALWDIKGKALDVPVYELLGGRVRDAMPAYSWIGGDAPNDVGEHARARVEEGFEYFKMNVAGSLDFRASRQDIDDVIRRIDEVNRAVGRSGSVAIDFHGRAEYPTARVLLKELEYYNPLFVEEPLRPELGNRLEDICHQTTIPIATGERLFSRHEFLAIAQSGVSIIQPDVSHAGGISETKRIANLAETFGIGLAPHSPLGPIALASSLQLDFTCHNAVFQETSLGIHYNADHDLLATVKNEEVFRLTNGAFSPPILPGLGLEVDEEAVRALSEVPHNWRNPIWRDANGAFAEW
ncbi:galactonate dehydratase [Gordonia hongkongensis]|uniref:galactonate dehydratase n=1 Tax=Gordonia hongkongensis TaxID=1701090 RepID=UPI003D734625